MAAGAAKPEGVPPDLAHRVPRGADATAAERVVASIDGPDELHTPLAACAQQLATPIWGRGALFLGAHSRVDAASLQSITGGAPLPMNTVALADAANDHPSTTAEAEVFGPSAVQSFLRAMHNYNVPHL